MKSVRVVLAAVIVCVLLLPAGESRAQSRAELPNDVTLELLGRCFLYSFSYQRMVGEHFAFEAGGSVLASSEGGAGLLSLGGRAYLTRGNAAPCIAGGIVFGSSLDGANSDDSASYFYVGPGFEYRSDGGFVLRGGVNFLIFEEEEFIVWPGVQVGIAF